MARMYTVPPDMKEKEKIIGGVLNINQFFWLVGGFVLGAILFIATWSMAQSVVLSVLCAVLAIASSTPFMFYKKKELTLFLYYKRKKAFKKKSKKLINQRKGDVR